MIIAISWRNVWRNPMRSLVIITAVALGLTAGIFSLALMNGLTEQKMRTAIENQTAHIQLHHIGFSVNKDIKLHIPEIEKTEDLLAQHTGINTFSLRTVVGGMIASSKGSEGVQFNGIDPGQEKEVTAIWKQVIEGTYFEKGGRKPILISQKMAEKLEVKLKSKVVLTMQDAQGEIVGAAFRVVGIFKTYSTAFDESQVFVPREALQEIAKLPNSIHEIALILNDIEEVPLIKSNLAESLNPNTKVEDWKEVLPELAYLSDASIQTNVLFLAIILTALAFGILNTMLMSVFERIKEIGVLMAVGMNKGKVFRMIVTETVFLSLSGAFIGMLLGVALINWTATNGINLSMFSEGLASWGVADVVYPSLSISFYFMLMIMVLVTALLASLYPAQKALGLRPAEALHGLNN